MASRVRNALASWRKSTVERFRRARADAQSVREGCVEPLEARRLFAITASLAGGVLTVTSTATSDAINIARDTTAGDDIYVYQRVGDQCIWIAGPYAAANVSSIVANGNGGHDDIWVESNLWKHCGDKSVDKPATINGGTGNDTLTGGDADDQINGGDDNDFIYDSDGNNALNGDDGDDYISGGAGNDIIHGGADNDTCFDNPGGDEDWVYGDTGDDVLGTGDGDSLDHMIGGTNNPAPSMGDGITSQDAGDIITGMEY